MGRWLEHSVTTEIQAPVEQVWEVWSDLEAMPQWMRWIESVTTLDDPDLTDWTLSAQGFRFHWKARITQRVEAQQLHWESVWATICSVLLGIQRSPGVSTHWSREPSPSLR